MWWSIYSMSGQPANHPIKYQGALPKSPFQKVVQPELETKKLDILVHSVTSDTVSLIQNAT